MSPFIHSLIHLVNNYQVAHEVQEELKLVKYQILPKKEKDNVIEYDKCFNRTIQKAEIQHGKQVVYSCLYGTWCNN